MANKKAPRPLQQLYAITAPNGLVNIGSAYTASRAFHTLQNGSPERLELSAKMSAPPELKSALHAALVQSHSHSEWFHPTDPVLRVVELIGSHDTVALLEYLEQFVEES